MNPLVFTTTKPYSMFGNISERDNFLIPTHDENGNFLFKGTNVPKNSEHLSRYIYLHYDLEERAGFDIPVFLEGDFPEESGIYPCIGLIPEEVNCVLYLWINKYPSRTTIHGLIVLVSDEEGNKNAYKKYKEEIWQIFQRFF